MGERSGETAGQGSVGMFCCAMKLVDHSCDVRARVTLLKCDATSMNLHEREDVRTENFVTVLNTCQIASNDLQLGSVMCGDASPIPSCFHRRTLHNTCVGVTFSFLLINTTMAITTVKVEPRLICKEAAAQSRLLTLQTLSP